MKWEKGQLIPTVELELALGIPGAYTKQARITGSKDWCLTSSSIRLSDAFSPSHQRPHAFRYPIPFPLRSVNAPLTHQRIHTAGCLLRGPLVEAWSDSSTVSQMHQWRDVWYHYLHCRLLRNGPCSGVSNGISSFNRKLIFCQEEYLTTHHFLKASTQITLWSLLN